MTQPAQNVMVLYTGGTIGMQASANGLAPASGFEARMREQLAHLPAPTWRFREMAPLTFSQASLSGTPAGSIEPVNTTGDGRPSSWKLMAAAL